MAQTKVKLISDGVIVQGNLHASHGITTAHIGEGSNLYYTDARVGSYLSTNSFATESYVGTQIANLVDSSPSALNTLNELAAALGDDANFSTTVTNSIALKAPLASPSFTGTSTFAGGVNSTRFTSTTASGLHWSNYTGNQGWQIGADSTAAGMYIYNENGVYAMKLTSGGNATFAGSIFLDGFTNPSTSYISLRESFVPSASGGIGLMAKDHSGSSNDGLALYGHDGISIHTAQAERLRINSSGTIRIGTTPGITPALLSSRRNGTCIEFGHTNNNGRYEGTLGSFGSNGSSYIGFSTECETNLNTFTTRGAKGNIISGDGNGNLQFQQITNANATGQTPVTRMTIDSSGNVMMGRTSQSGNAALTVRSTAGGNTGVILIEGDTPNDGWGMYAVTADEYRITRFTNGSYSDKFIITSDGNVGIGASPVGGRKLQVAGRVYIEHQGTDWNETTPGLGIGAIHLDPAGSGANNTGNAITFGASDHANGTVADAGIYTRSDGSFGTKMYFATTDSYATGSKTRMMINESGRVGIGTTSPDAKFQVEGNIKVGSASGASWTDAQDDIGGLDVFIGSGSNAFTVWDDNQQSAPRFAVSRAGNVGVGGFAGVKFEVYSGSLRVRGSSANVIELSNINGNTRATLGNYGNEGDLSLYRSNNVKHVYLSSYYDSYINPGGGNLGIGTTAPFSKLQVGNKMFDGTNGMYNNGRVGISNHGNLTGMMLASTYNDATHSEYGLVFVQGPNTSSYNVWSISPDGPAKGSSLNFHYQAQATNVHAPANAKVSFVGSTGRVGIGTASPVSKLQVLGGAVNAQHIVRGPYTVGLAGTSIGNGTISAAFNFNGYFNTGYTIEVYAIFNHWNSANANYTYCYKKALLFGYNAAGAAQIDGPGGGYSNSVNVGAWTFSVDNNGPTGYGQRVIASKSAGSAGWHGTYMIQIVSSVPLDPLDVS